MNPENLIKSIETGLEKYLTEDQRGRTNPANVYASAYSPCARRLALNLEHTADLQPFETETLARFKRGQDRERDMVILLNRIGQYAEPQFSIVGSQERIEIVDEAGPIITGKLDSMIQIGRDKYPIEIKSYHPNISSRIDDVGDMISNYWTNKAIYQLSTYICLKDAPFGLFILDTPSLPKLIPVTREIAEGCYAHFFSVALEAMTAHRAGGILPDYIDDLEECRHCDFYGAHCTPPIMTDPAKILTDEDLEREIERWLELQEAGKEWNALDKSVKARLRGIESGICGNALITGKWQSYTRLELPDLVKEQIKALEEPFKIKDPKGSFRMKIVRL